MADADEERKAALAQYRQKTIEVRDLQSRYDAAAFSD